MIVSNVSNKQGLTIKKLTKKLEARYKQVRKYKKDKKRDEMALAAKGVDEDGEE